jgi:YcaO-like protein with predicted kinase domain
VTAAETLRCALPIAAAKGVTRVADITGLDRLGIPVHSSVVPRSDDGISVYNGKGLTAVDSRAAAVMEAIERQTALEAEVPLIDGSYETLLRSGRTVIDPRFFIHKLRDDFSEDRPYSWIEGYDLIASEPVLVPAGLAGYGPRYMGELSPYEINSSNGLASGNCFEEALCHALCELIERDAWTFADLRSRWIPRARREVIFGRDIAALDFDDLDACPRIDLSDAGEPLAGLLEKFTRAGLNPVVRDMTHEFGIPCVVACVADDCVPGFPQAHAGMGAHPNATIAVTRAVTELAQSRAVDIQGVREDIMPPGIDLHPAERQTQRAGKIEAQRWMLRQAGRCRPFRDMASVENEDIACDIRLILSRLVEHRIERVVVVDLSEAGSPFAVIRALVPGLEFWSLEQGKLGDRAVRFWREHA